MDEKRYMPFSTRNLQLGNGRTKICVPLVGRDWKELGEQIDLIREEPFDLVEWRADYLEGGTDAGTAVGTLQKIRAELDGAVILFTFRTRGEGGEQEITEAGYRKLCLEAASSGLADLIDVEYHMGEEMLETLIRGIQKSGTGVICSCHDFKQTPPEDEILHTLCRMQSLGADITKMAVMPQNRMDVLRLMQASAKMEEQYADRPFITMSMGRLGALSRLAGYLDGSALTFAAAGRASAPGQMSAAGVRDALGLLS